MRVEEEFLYQSLSCCVVVIIIFIFLVFIIIIIRRLFIIIGLGSLVHSSPVSFFFHSFFRPFEIIIAETMMRRKKNIID